MGGDEFWELKREWESLFFRGGGNHYPLSENHDWRAVCTFLFHSGPVEKYCDMYNWSARGLLSDKCLFQVT